MRMLFASLALALPLFAAGPAFAETTNKPGVISVEGMGSVEIAPDMATITSGVVTQDKEARAALSANNTAMNALIGVIKGAGIEDKDIQTSGFSVYAERYGSVTIGDRGGVIVSGTVLNAPLEPV